MTLNKFNPETDCTVIKTSTKRAMILVEHSPSSYQIFCKPRFDPKNWHGVGDYSTQRDALRAFREFGG